MAGAIPSQGILHVAGPAELARRDQADAQARAERAAVPDAVITDLAAFIDRQWEIMRNHRDSAAGWSMRLVEALRAFNGKYSPDKLREIRQFGGSEVYARLTSVKCRGTSSLLRDVYLSNDRPWGIDPPADPDVPVEIAQKIASLVATEANTAAQMGGNIDPTAIRDRVNSLMDAARQAEKRNAKKRAKIAEDKIQEILVKGGFYRALSEAITDVPLFPIVCIKGPVVRVIPTVSWDTGMPVVKQVPTLFWMRVSPFDLWWSPDAADIESANVIERSRVTRAELNDLLDLPGFNHEAIRSVLRDYGQGGLNDFMDTTDSERANEESRENPWTNRSGSITQIEFHGNVQGQMLLDWGMDKKMVPDADRDYAVQAWKIGRYVIKVQLTPSPRKRHPYFVTSFEKVPGTPVGNALPDILSDLQDVSNATLRALVNNMSISSGPQVVVNDDRLSGGESGDELYPWKRWHVASDPMGNNTQAPVSFFMPTSNAQELLAVYQKFADMADEMSAIPKYMSGANAGGVGRTASGLSMLMANASKVLQTVASNIDGDIIGPALDQLFDMVMLTDTTGILRGDEAVRIKGVQVAVQRETERVRQLEFLRVTANPMDAQIMGQRGRAEVLRSVSQTIGMDGAKLVPSDEDIEAAAKAQQMAQAIQQGQPNQGGQPQLPAAARQAQGNEQGAPVTKDMGPRTNLHGATG